MLRGCNNEAEVGSIQFSEAEKSSKAVRKSCRTGLLTGRPAPRAPLRGPEVAFASSQPMHMALTLLDTTTSSDSAFTRRIALTAGSSVAARVGRTPAPPPVAALAAAAAAVP